MKKKPTVAGVRSELDIRDEDSMPVGDYIALRRLVLALKAERERRGLSLADLSVATRISAPALSNLETGKNPNPTVNTLFRYAGGLGKAVRFSVE